MKTGLLRALIAASIALVIVAVNYSIAAKERVKTEGQQIYLALQPVDPRSLMQGDYMALRFALADDMQRAGYLEGQATSAPLVLDENGVARLDESPEPAGPRIRFRIRHNQIWLGTNAYFFEEGTAERYERVARFGVFRLDTDSGEAVLVGLADEQLNLL